METEILEDKLLNLFFSISKNLREGMSFDFGGKNLTLHQLQLLIFIAQQKQPRMIDIAEKFNVKMPSATSLIDTLVKNGYVKRISNKNDRRAVYVTLGKKGVLFLQKAKQQKSDRIGKILSYMSIDDKKHLFRILNALSERLDEN